MIPAPMIFLALPWLAAAAVYVCRQRGWRAAEVTVAIGAALTGAALAVWLPLEAAPFLRDSFGVLGRRFVMEAADRGALGQIFLLAGLVFFGAALRPQGRFFLAAGTAALGLLAAALFVRPFLFAAIFLELAAALAVFMLADQAHPDTRGALRYLTYKTLGMPFILFTGWLVETSAANPQDPQLLTLATYSLAAGLAILLGVAPFHSWVPVVAEHAPPLATAFVTTVMRVPIVFLTLKLLATEAWLGGNPLVYNMLTLAGFAMVGLGALFVFGQQNLGRSVGYALVIEIGAVLLAIGLGTLAGVEAALAALALRGLGMWLWAVGLDELRRSAADSSFEALRGLGWRHPFAVTAVAMGMLSLVGLPLMAGFPPRWALLRLLMEQTPALAAILLAAMTSVGVVIMRGLAALTTPKSPDDVIQPEESRLGKAAFSAGVLLVLLLGAFPQWVLPAATGAASALAPR